MLTLQIYYHNNFTFECDLWSHWTFSSYFLFNEH